jgi:hypothetical protein
MKSIQGHSLPSGFASVAFVLFCAVEAGREVRGGHASCKFKPITMVTWRAPNRSVTC